jgi:nucleolar protein 9
MPASIVEKSTGDIDVHLHGSLILQSILRFNKPIKIVQSILEMKPQTLSDVFCHPKGSRVADAFVESKFIGEKSREKLIKHLEGMYMKLALSKNGSHVLEKLYQLSSESQKEVIVKELAERLNQLNGSGCGRIISYKFNVEVYSRNVNQWKNFLSRT